MKNKLIWSVKSTMTKWLIMLLLLPMILLPQGKVFAGQSKSKPIKLELTQDHTVQEALCVPSDKIQMTIRGIPSKKIKWISSRKNVATVSKKGTVEAKRPGKAIITGKYKGGRVKCKVIVYTKNQYLKKWVKDWISTNIDSNIDDFNKVLRASYYVTHYFDYGRTSTAFDVLKKGKGTCYSGGKLLVELLKAMGYKAKVRFAAKDNMSRYPMGIQFMSKHYNVKVTIHGKNYYIDGTPGSMCIYLSSEKEPLYYVTDWDMEE